MILSSYVTSTTHASFPFPGVCEREDCTRQSTMMELQQFSTYWIMHLCAEYYMLIDGWKDIAILHIMSCLKYRTEAWPLTADGLKVGCHKRLIYRQHICSIKVVKINNENGLNIICYLWHSIDKCNWLPLLSASACFFLGLFTRSFLNKVPGEHYRKMKKISIKPFCLYYCSKVVAIMTWDKESEPLWLVHMYTPF